MKLEVNISEKAVYAVVFSLVVFIVLAGVYAAWAVPSPAVWHTADQIKVTVNSIDYSLAELLAPAPLVPAGAVMYFNLVDCPAGWAEITAARGRYIVGLPNGGALAGTQGTALTNRAIRQVLPAHSHTFTSGNTFLSGFTMYRNLYVESGGNGPVVTDTITSTGTPSGTISNSPNTSEIDAPYIQFLVCQKCVTANCNPN